MNGKNRKVLFVKSAITAKAPEVKSILDVRSADTGNTEQAVYEAAIQIANLLEDSLKSIIAYNA